MKKKWLFLMFAIVAVLALTACGSNESESSDSKEKVKLTMFVWAGANQEIVPKEVVEKYMDKHPNVEVEIVESSNSVMYPKMVAGQKTDPDNPVVNFGYFNVDATLKGLKDDMWEPLDESIVTNMAAIPEKYHTEDNKGIIWGVSDFALVYNKEEVKTAPTSWNDLWENDEYKGKVALWDYLFYSYVPPIIDLKGKEIGATYEKPSAAFEYIKQNISQVNSLVTSADQLQNLLVTGEATIAPYSLQSAQAWVDSGAPLEVVVPKEGSISFPYYLQVVKGSTPEQQKVANEIINELIKAENLEKYAELTGTPFTSTEAQVPEKYANNPIFDLNNRSQSLVNPNWEIITSNNSEWTEVWDKTVKRALQ